MFRTVYGRVVTVLVAVFVAMFLIFVGVTFISTRLYHEEVMLDPGAKTSTTEP